MARTVHPATNVIDLGMVELQGKLHFVVEKNCQRSLVGHFHNADAPPNGDLLGLYTGNYVLTGKMLSLTHPRAILQKRSKTKKYSCCTVGIIKSLLVYSSRPDPFVSSDVENF